MKNRCRDEGERPGCLGEADDRYTMNFDDIGEKPIYWCSACGPEAQAMNDVLTENFRTDPTFARRLEEAMDQVEKKAAN